MAVRNFWVNAEIDGQKTELSGGPRSKDGGMFINLNMRVNGRPVSVLHVTCAVNDDGTLRARIHTPYLPEHVNVEVDASLKDEDGTRSLADPPPLLFNELFITTKR